jgi:hypothetical protein
MAARGARAAASKPNHRPAKVLALADKVIE